MYNISKGDPLVSLDFFENAMAHPRMKIQVLVSPKQPLVKKNNFKKSVGKHDLSMSFFCSKIFVIFFGINIDQNDLKVSQNVCDMQHVIISMT